MLPYLYLALDLFLVFAGDFVTEDNQVLVIETAVNDICLWSQNYN